MKGDINWHDDVIVTSALINNYDFRKPPLDNTMEKLGTKIQDIDNFL